MTEGTVGDLNSKLSGSAFIHQNNRRSHMWDADTMLYYLEFLEVEVRKRRMELGLSVEGNKALIICDKASVHSCQKFELYRKQWQDRNNCILLHGSSTDTITIPGGFGAAGGPNESWMYIYIIFIHKFICMWVTAYRHEYIYIYIYIYTYIYIHYIHIYIYAYIHTDIHIYIYAYIHTCMHACMHTYIHTYVRTYVHTYIHT